MIRSTFNSKASLLTRPARPILHRATTISSSIPPLSRNRSAVQTCFNRRISTGHLSALAHPLYTNSGRRALFYRPHSIMANKDSHDIVAARQNELADAFHSADVDKLMTFFTEDVVFSDIAMKAIDLDYAKLRGFYKMMFSKVKDMTISKTTISGSTPEFVIWEMDLSFVAKVDEDLLGIKEGQKVLMRGVCVQHWREEKGKWKIWKEADYFIH